MWQRWNQSTHIFEKSDDNGGVWTPLGLSADIISEGTLSIDRLPVLTKAKQHASTAYIDAENPFALKQTYSSNNVHASSTGLYVNSISTANLRLYFDPTFTYMRVGLAGSWYLQNSVATNVFQINGAGSTLQNSGAYVYPGSASGLSAFQTSYYLASHSAYGLFTNAGLFVSTTLFAGGDVRIYSNGGPYYVLNAAATGWNAVITSDSFNRTSLFLNTAQLRLIGYVEGGVIGGGLPSNGSINTWIDGIGAVRIPYFV